MANGRSCPCTQGIRDLLTTAKSDNSLLRKIQVHNCREDVVRRALRLAEKYSLIARSIKAEVIIEPEIVVVEA